jgi:hypothetical protein
MFDEDLGGRSAGAARESKADYRRPTNGGIGSGRREPVFEFAKGDRRGEEDLRAHKQIEKCKSARMQE